MRVWISDVYFMPPLLKRYLYLSRRSLLTQKLHSRAISDGNPFTERSIYAEITGTESKTVHGFYDGNGVLSTSPPRGHLIVARW